jgi:hypothetical protein
VNTATFIAIIVLAAAMILFRGGSLDSALPMLVIAALVLALPWYFGTRDRTKPASGVERVLARCWRWFRYIVCGGISLLLFYFSAAPLLFGKLSWDSFFWSAGFALAGILVTRLAIFGHGGAYYGDDLGTRNMHSENKSRYERRE